MIGRNKPLKRNSAEVASFSAHLTGVCCWQYVLDENQAEIDSIQYEAVFTEELSTPYYNIIINRNIIIRTHPMKRQQ